MRSVFANKNKLILVIEDDKEAAKAVIETLQNEGYQTVWKQNGPEVLQIASESLEEYYCVLLDLGISGLVPARLGHPEMPEELGGLLLLDKWRKANIWVPVIILTNRIEVQNQIKGMACKPDDYITKPFVPALLLSRIEMVNNRRVRRPEPRILSFGGVSLNEATRELLDGDGKPFVDGKGKALTLTAKEYSVMECLIESRGGYCSKDQLESYIYGNDYDDEEAKTNALGVTFNGLRQKIENTPVMIKNSRGMGWRLVQKPRTAS